MASDRAIDEGRRDAFVERLFGSALGAFDLFTVYLGQRLGLYRALADGGPATPEELASRAGTHERYSREWLEQQAVTGILEVGDSSPGRGRRYRLPAAHAEVLLDEESLNYLGFLSKMAVAVTRPIDRLLEAYRSGGGVPWDAYGDDMREGQAEQNRPVFHHFLGSEWIPAVPDVHDRLRADPPARVADVACGAGWSSIGIARAYPRVRVDGLDLDGPAIEMARRNAEAAGVADRVAFEVRDASDPALSGRYDLATVFEAVHDLSRPVEVLRAIRGLLAEGGTVLVMDERVEDGFTAPGHETERLFYHFSVLICLANGMAEHPSAATGTVMRTDTLRRYSEEAGFRDLEVLAIDHDFFRFYRLHP